MNSKQIISIWTRVLVEACEGRPANEQKKIILRLEEILKRKKKEYLFSRIVKRATAIRERRSKVVVTLAHEQSAEIIDKLKESFPRQIEGRAAAEIIIDKNIIGGFVAKTEEYVLDASVKNCLQRLKNKYDN